MSASDLVLLRQADVFAPSSLGRQDLLVAGGRIAALAPTLGSAASFHAAGVTVAEIDCGGWRLVPGLLDLHVHVTGGGGESGPASRVPPITAAALLEAGITSVVGVLGTDGTTRTMASLVARTLGLRKEGLSAWCYTGSYEVPPKTLTGSVRDDLVFVDPIIGVGELAISDHRSSQPTLDELLRVAADAHVGGLMSGKAGIVHLHLGDGKRGLDLVRRALDGAELPARVFHPTHVNRRAALFDEALGLAARGCTIDVTAFPPEAPLLRPSAHSSPSPSSALGSLNTGPDSTLDAADAILRYFAAKLPRELLTCSSDGAGCLPVFDSDGNMVAMDVGKPAVLLETLRQLLSREVPLEAALPVFTSNVARLLRLPKKGRIEVGADADLVLLDVAGTASLVLSGGRVVVENGVKVA